MDAANTLDNIAIALLASRYSLDVADW
jgi:hypothetical protein